MAVQVIADGISEGSGVRLTSMLLTYPLFIHNQLLTHRAFSRSSASARALPVEAVLTQVIDEPVVPVMATEAKTGMTAGAPLKGRKATEALSAWMRARDAAIIEARELELLGVHRSVVNRLLEPFRTITTLVTATEWANFFALRTTEDPQAEFTGLARAAYDAYHESVPDTYPVGAWFTPLLTDEERTRLPLGAACDISAARCARLSFGPGATFSHDRDLKLAVSLKRRGEWGPFEHQAFSSDAPRFSGNLRGWVQYRKLFTGENVETMPEKTW